MKFLVALAFLVAVAVASECNATTNVKPLYSITDADCPRADFCYSEFCSCLTDGLGPKYDNNTKTCPTLNGYGDCAKLSKCSRAAITCMNVEAEVAIRENQCKKWAKPIFFELLTLEDTPADYVNSTLGAACQQQACMWTNATTCAPNYDAVCAAPSQYYGTLRLTGDWTKVIATEEKKKALKTALRADFHKKLGVRVNIFSMVLGSLIVEFTIPDLNENTTALIATAGESADWLADTTTVFHKNGGEGDFTVSFIGKTVVDTPPPTAAPTDNGSDDKKKCGTGCVVGIIIGVVVFVVLVGLVVFVRGKKGDDEEGLTDNYGTSGTKYSSV